MRIARTSLLCALLLACGPSRQDELEAELQKVAKERVARAEVEKVRAEADAAEAALPVLRAQLEEDTTREATAAARREARARSLERARSDVEAERAALEAIRQEIARERAAAQALDLEIAARREQARPLREQAAALARELRPEDPAWATERRLLVLKELARKVASAYPDDPVFQKLAGDARAETARARAEALRDRLAWIYALDESPGDSLARP